MSKMAVLARLAPPEPIVRFPLMVNTPEALVKSTFVGLLGFPDPLSSTSPPTVSVKAPMLNWEGVFGPVAFGIKMRRAQLPFTSRVTVNPRSIITVSLEVGTVEAVVHVAPPLVEISHVAAVFQLPVCRLRYWLAKRACADQSKAVSTKNDM
jgi:hypothetical protein